MDITEVKVFLKDSPDRKLRAYATVTFDNAFVVRNIKVIQGTAGLFIAMPSRKVRHPCPACGAKNEIRSRFCSQCGTSLPQPHKPAAATADAGSQAEHKDIAHPITQAFRELLQKKVLAGYEEEVKKGPAAARATGDE